MRALDADLLIVGAGILGLATAREMLTRHEGSTVLVVDKEPEVGAHQTSHNSGVIHAGVYYAPGSLKARLCVAGSRALYEYCEERGIPTDRCGKLVIAVSAEELPGLDELERRSRANGVEGLSRIDGSRIPEFEPHAHGVAALHVASTGIVDFAAVARALADDVRELGGEIRMGTSVESLRAGRDGVVAGTSGGEGALRHAGFG